MSAVNLSNTLINSIGLNSTINVSNFSINFDKLVVSNISIIFYNLTYTNPLSCYGLSNYSIFNYTTKNEIIELPTNCNKIIISVPDGLSDVHNSNLNLQFSTDKISSCVFSFNGETNQTPSTSNNLSFSSVIILYSPGFNTIDVFCNSTFGYNTYSNSTSRTFFYEPFGNDQTIPLILKNNTNQTINQTNITDLSNLTNGLEKQKVKKYKALKIIVGVFLVLCLVLVAIALDLRRKKKK